MERVQVLALVVIVAALALFSAGYVVDGGGSPPGDEVVAGPLGDGARARIGITNRETGPRRGAPRSGSDEPSGPRGGRGAGAGDGERRAGSAETIAGARRAAGGAGRGGGETVGDVELAANGVPADLRAARTGTLPRAGGGLEAAPAHHAGADDGTAEPPPEPQPHDPGGVLLSIPLKGSIDPDRGGGPTRADGVVVDGDAVEFTDQAQYTLPAAGHVDGQMGTIAFDIEPHWAGSDETNNSLLQIRDEHQWANNLQIVKNYDSLRFIIIDSSGFESDVNVSIDAWQPNEAHRVTATWGEALMVLYVDGQPVGQMTLPNDLAFKDSTPIHVGSDFPGSVYRGADGRISNLMIYGRALTAGEVN